MLANIQLQRFEPHLSLDIDADPSWLETSTSGRRIDQSVRYSNDDVAKYGWLRVREWIRQDHERLASYQRGEWSFLNLRVAAIAVVQGERQELGELEVASACLGGVESDAPQDYFKQLTDELLQEVKLELESLGMRNLDNIQVKAIVAD